MNSYVGMAMVKKERGQDDYFNQQSTLPEIIIALQTLLLHCLKYGTVALTDLHRNGSSENSVFQVML